MADIENLQTWPAAGLRIAPLAGRGALIVGALAAAAALLGDRLAATNADEVGAALSATPPGAVALALALTALSYLAVSFYDPVALARAGRRRPLGEALRVGFTATALGQCLGFGLVVAAIARWRMHRVSGMTAAEAAAVSLRICIAFYLGLIPLLLVAAVFAPDLIERLFGLSALETALAAAAGLALLAAAALGMGEGGLRRLAVSAALAAADLIPAGLALWVLLPPEVAPPAAELVLVYCVALVAGQMSGAPGGIGFFEATMLLAWPELATAELLAAILLWRGVYYGAPLALASLLLADALAEGPCGRPLARLATRLGRRAPPPAGASDRDRVAWILDAGARAEGALALLGDKRFAFSPCGRAFLMYGVRGRRWVAMGDPHGPEAAWVPLWSAFREEARRAGAKTSVYKAKAAAFWRAQGLRPQIVGEEAELDPRAFALTGRKRRELRRKCGQAARAGLSVTAYAPHEAPLEALAEISAEWSQPRRERSFSTGHFDPDYLANFPVFAAYLDGRCVAFISVWVSGDGSEHALDLMRHTADAPRGAMHALVVAAIEAANAAGATRFSLCMAPLSGLGRAEEGRALSRLLALVYLRGEKAHGFRGLRRFKECFRPEWSPRYVVAKSQTEALATLLAVRGMSNAPGARLAPRPLRTAKIIPWERGAWLRRSRKAVEDRAARRKAG